MNICDVIDLEKWSGENSEKHNDSLRRIRRRAEKSAESMVEKSIESNLKLMELFLATTQAMRKQIEDLTVQNQSKKDEIVCLRENIDEYEKQIEELSIRRSK
jgi:phosphate uptake regulator